jgi:RNA polymerase sigma-70 factor, ECF subfamily
MALSLQAFRSSHGGLIGELYAEVNTTPRATLELARDVFESALWRSVEKSGVAEACIPQYLRGLRVTDLALAAACAAGSEAAWQTLLSTMRAPLRAAGRAMAGDAGEELADSLFGELYASRHSKLGSYAGRSSLAGWLRAVLRQTWIDRLRAGKRLQPMNEDAPEPAAPATPDPVERTETISIARRALDQAMESLPPRQKLLLDFYYFHGLNLRESAGLVGVHEATASRELDRARGALKVRLTEILRAEHHMDDDAVRTCLLEAVEKGLDWRPQHSSGVSGGVPNAAAAAAGRHDSREQETPPSNVLLKERL